MIENYKSYRQSSFGLSHGRTRLGSGLRAVAPRCLSGENAGRTMTVLHHALCGDDFDQTPVSIIFREKTISFFCFCFVDDATQVPARLVAPHSGHIFYPLPQQQQRRI